MDQESNGKPFFLAMNTQSSHFPYLIPDDCPRPFQPCDLDSDVSFVGYPVEKTPHVRNAYYNGLAESDRQIGRLVDKLTEWGLLDDVILVITGENGEAFHENGAISHAGNPVEPVIHVAAVVYWPGLIEPRMEDYPFEHVDLAPTLCGLCASTLCELSRHRRAGRRSSAGRGPLDFRTRLEPSRPGRRRAARRAVGSISSDSRAASGGVVRRARRPRRNATAPPMSRPWRPSWPKFCTSGVSASWRITTTPNTTAAITRRGRRGNSRCKTQGLQLLGFGTIAGMANAPDQLPLPLLITGMAGVPGYNALRLFPGRDIRAR